MDCSTSFFILYCIVRCNNTTYLYRSSTCLDVSFHFILDYSRGFLGLCYYIVTGGFRVVAGIGFFGIVIPSILIFTFFYPLQYADFQNLFPIAQHSFLEIMKGMKGNMFSFFGFEMLLLYYPFIKKARTSQKYAHYANLVTTIVYTYLMILTLAFFSEKQLASAIWAYLSMIKIIQFPFIERFEYIIVSVWAFLYYPMFPLHYGE